MNAAAGLVEVRVPDMGNFKDVAVIDVLVKPGESIEPEAPLVTLETEKATMDVPSNVGGVIEKIHIAKGGTVSTGDLIATVRSEAAQPPSAPSPASSGQRPAASAGSVPSAASVPSAPSVPSTTAATAATPPPASPRAPPQPSPASSEEDEESDDSRKPPAGASGRLAREMTDPPPINEPGFSRAHAGPSVRRFARELGVDLTRVAGSGFKGRVTHDDVKGFVKQHLTDGAVSAPAPAGAPVMDTQTVGLPAVPVVDFAQFGPVETLPLSRIQRISGPRLHASWVNIPHVTQFDEADITELDDVRTKMKQKALQEGIKLTTLAFIMRACVKALQEFPVFNASLDRGGLNLIVKKYLNIGFAADTRQGLVVPVVHDVNRKDVYEIARQLAELSEKARAGKLSAAQMQGGCFTISSLGGIGGTAFTPIINAPEVAILGVSRARTQAVFREGAFAPRSILPLSLSYDHRVIDGATAARFTTYVSRCLADPRALLEAVP